MRLRPTRVLLAAGGGALLGAVVLAGATRLVLGSDWLLGEIDGNPDALFVTFTGSRASLVPGRLRFATVTVRSRDPNVEWEARLRDVTLQVGLLALAGRRLHVSTLRAAALSFRLRERLAAAEAAPALLARDPPIAGFPRVPLRDPRERRTPPGDPWEVDVDDLRVDRVREVWIDSWRWAGGGSLAGGFHLRPGVEAEVVTSELGIENGVLTWGADVVSRGTRGRIRAALPKFATKAYPGNEVWRIVSGSASLQGSLEAAPFLAPTKAGPRFPDGGSVRLEVAVSGARGDGRIAARLGDARPLLALLPPGPGKWLAGFAGLRALEATGRLSGRPGLLAASPAHAESGTLSIDADLRKTPDGGWGAVLVRKGRVALGFGIGPGAASFRAVGAAAWFESEARPGGLRTDQPRAVVGAARPSR